MIRLRTGHGLSFVLLLSIMFCSPAFAQSTLIADGMVTPSDATTASEIVIVQMRTGTEMPGYPFVVSADPPRLVLSSQASDSLPSQEGPLPQNLGQLAAGTWEVHGYGVDWRGAGSVPQFEGFSGPSTFYVTDGEVYPMQHHSVAGEPLVLRVVGPGGPSCAPLVDDVSVEGAKVVVHARRPNCQPPQNAAARFGVNVSVPPLAAGKYRVEVQVPETGGEGVEILAAASFRTVPPVEPRIRELKIEPDTERHIHFLVAVIETPRVTAADGCTSWNVSARNAWSHGRDLYALFDLEPTAATCGEPLVETFRIPLPELETGLYRILAQRQQAPGVSEFWAQSKTLEDVQKLGQLIDGRFRISVTWRDHRNRTGRGVPVPASQFVQGDDSESAIFYFFGEDNWELLVKVLDGCTINNHYWVFASAGTNVEYTLTVDDLVSGAQASYRNELGQRSPAITDTAAFAACP